MRYRTERGGASQPYQPTGIAWLIGFPGHITFLLSWTWAIGVACLKIGALFVSNQGRPGGSQPSLNLDVTGNSTFSPLVTLLLWAFALLSLMLAYWGLANLTIRTIARMADFLDTSVWTVKGVGLVLGCGLAAIASMTMRAGVGLQALDAAAIFCGIGLCSFWFEYMHSRRTIAAEHDK